MKIRKILIEENEILGEKIELDFTDSNGNILDTIIFVGENGSGKSTLLNIIYNFSTFSIISGGGLNEKRVFEVEFSDTDMSLVNSKKIEFGLQDIELSNIFEFSYDLSKQGTWEQISIINKTTNRSISNGLFRNDPVTKSLLKSLFSDVSINFNPTGIESIKNNDTDTDIKESQKSSENISTEITQMLVDIRAKDNEEQVLWENDNMGFAPENLREKRTKRFKNAFREMFQAKLEYIGVKDLSPIFKKGNSEINIKNLSSGEKQIVFRGSYLLKDRESVKGALVLIDEPEISLHPLWQQNILKFYQKLFENEAEEQTSQILITTHSPYVLQGIDRDKCKLFVFPAGKCIDDFRSYIGKIPSLGIVNYLAYNLPSIELHDELYGYIQDKALLHTESETENYLKTKVTQPKSWISEKWNWQTNKLNISSPYNITLQSFIRNKVHHPENKSMENSSYSDEELKLSIDEMIGLIEVQSL